MLPDSDRAGNRTHDHLIYSPTAYRYATLKIRLTQKTMSVAHLITKQLVTVTLTSVTDSTTGELRQELDADLCRLLPCSLDPSLSVSLPPMIVSRLQQELFCWQWPIVTDDSQSARRLANSLSFALKLLGCDEARNNIGHTLSHGKSTENSYEWKKSSVKKNTLLHYKERCNKYERFWV